MKMPSWVLGEQAATTTRLRRCSAIVCFISSWESWLQVKRFWPANTTCGSVRACSTTAFTSTTPAMLTPQLQTKTPMRGSSAPTSTSAGVSTCRVRVLRPAAKSRPARLAAALASATDPGMSFGPWNTPQAKTPGREVATGKNGGETAKRYLSTSMPRRWASSPVSFVTCRPTESTTMSKDSACRLPLSST